MSILTNGTGSPGYLQTLNIKIYLPKILKPMHLNMVGFCAYGVAQSALVEIDPQSWAIVENKLYLNYNPAVQRLWQEDVSGYIAQADKNWPQL